MFSRKIFSAFLVISVQFLLLLKLLTLCLLPSGVLSISNNRFCDEDEYFRPYIEISRKRGGIPIKSVYSTEFVDLRSSYGVLLCINGPAYWYGELEYHANVTKRELNTTVFLAKPANMSRVYEHECFSINRPLVLPEDPYSEPIPAGITKAEKDKFHKLSLYPTEPMTPRTNVSGTKVYGIALVGAEGNYRSPSMYMFSEASFGVNLQNVMISSSFAITGKNEFICEDKFTNKTLILQSPATTELFICQRSELGDPFDLVFKRAHYTTDYVCRLGPSGATLVAPPAANVTPVVAPPKPTGKMIDRIGPILNPKTIGIKYSSLASFPVDQYGVGGNLTISNLPNANAYDPNYPYDFPVDFDSTASKPHQTLSVVLSECIPFPDQKAKCTDSLTKAGDPCDILESVLELKVMTWGAQEWKKDILAMIEDVFVHACPQISDIGAKAVVRLFSESLIASAAAKPKDPFWDFILTELTHCKNETQPMKYIVHSYGLQQELGPASGTNEKGSGGHITRALPEIKVQTNSTLKDVFYYEEAVEVDFEFNLVIDSMWKMFSTVLGYCNQFYEIKKSSIFPRLYSMFADDFLIPLQDKWIDPVRNDLYANVIGEVVFGQGGVWMETCLEGAYLHSSAEAYRAMRPLSLLDKNVTNHFITTPVH